MEETSYVREGRIQAKLEEAYAYKSNYTTTLAGHEFIVFPDVFNPEVFPSSHALVGTWLHLIQTLKPDSLLEIGAGAGYLSVLAALNGAKQVTATDVTQQAADNIKANIDQYNLGDRMRALCGSVYQPLAKNDRFDMIFWNLPFNHIDKPLEELNAHERTLFDPGYGLTETYIKEARQHLTDTGRLFLLFSNKLGHLDRLQELAAKYGWSLQLIEAAENTLSKSYGMYDEVDMTFYELIKQ
jgi:release factor glutamine methyltransferase